MVVHIHLFRDRNNKTSTKYLANKSVNTALSSASDKRARCVEIIAPCACKLCHTLTKFVKL